MMNQGTNMGFWQYQAWWWQPWLIHGGHLVFVGSLGRIVAALGSNETRNISPWAGSVLTTMTTKWLLFWVCEQTNNCILGWNHIGYEPLAQIGRSQHSKVTHCWVTDQSGRIWPMILRQTNQQTKQPKNNTTIPSIMQRKKQTNYVT